MRIISGSAKGRKLKQPVGFNIRPTGDKVKESIFTIIQFDIEGRCVLDLFAGTGQFGIEALSRGASSAVFVDSASESIKLIRENIKLCGFSELSAVYARDALRFLENDNKFDIIFVDPPYNTSLADRAVDKIVEFDKLNINGIIMCESKVGMSHTQIVPPYFLVKEYKYGSVIISKITRKNNNS
jgi:16S rRNA (guanine(966)-N(2))-methyltransferase RsmD